MTHHINRGLLAFAAAYLFLMPTNAVRFVHSITFGSAGACAVIALFVASRNHVTRIPPAGASILVPLFAWAAWSFASSIRRGSLARRFAPAYSVFVVTGSPAKDVATGLPRNFTGGRSWNMKSHFQRSDGLDACIQVRAATGRANAIVVTLA